MTTLSRQNILFVEDSPDALVLLTRALGPEECFSATTPAKDIVATAARELFVMEHRTTQLHITSSREVAERAARSGTIYAIAILDNNVHGGTTTETAAHLLSEQKCVVHLIGGKLNEQVESLDEFLKPKGLTVDMFVAQNRLVKTGKSSSIFGLADTITAFAKAAVPSSEVVLSSAHDVK